MSHKLHSIKMKCIHHVKVNKISLKIKQTLKFRHVIKEVYTFISLIEYSIVKNRHL